MRLISACLFAVAILAWGCDDRAVRARRAAPGEGVVSHEMDEAEGGGANEPDVEAAGGALAEVTPGGAGGAADDAAPDSVSVGTELRVEVNAASSTFVNLATASVVEASNDWDLRFEGWNIFTNGGESGGGKGAAFGPLPFSYFLAETEPMDVPFLIEDKAAGAFRDWYFYDGDWHTLYSRFHTYGVRSGGRSFKLQLLGYYGDVQGAPISALYRLRYAEVTAGSVGTIVELNKLDATAGGLGGNDTSPSGCLSLGTQTLQQLSPEQATLSTLWDLRFRRDAVSVNGGLGGPANVTAVDLDAEATEGEKLEAIKALTAEGTAARFASVDYAALTRPELKYRGDRVVSAFSDNWADLTATPPSLAPDNTWLVVSADGKSRFLLVLRTVVGPSQDAPGTVVLRISKVR